MKYYLVALFDNDSLKDIERLQRSIGKNIRIIKINPFTI